MPSGAYLALATAVIQPTVPAYWVHKIVNLYLEAIMIYRYRRISLRAERRNRSGFSWAA
jgi:hypothetical protein